MKHNIFIYLAYVAICIATIIVVIFGMKYTGSIWCMMPLVLPALIMMRSSDESVDEKLANIGFIKTEENEDRITYELDNPVGKSRSVVFKHITKSKHKPNNGDVYMIVSSDRSHTRSYVTDYEAKLFLKKMKQFK